MANILQDFANAVQRHPTRVAIVDGKGRETTFAQLQSRADQYAAAWHRKGITKGSRVLLAMPLDAGLYASLAALWSLGATVILPEPATGLAGLRHAAKVAGVTAFCSTGSYGLLKFIVPELWSLPHLRPASGPAGLSGRVAVADSDVALISFTSGTTDAPKAIPRSHGFLSAQHHAIAPLLDSTKAERDLVAFPVFVLINIACGQTSVLPNWKMSRLAAVTPAHVAGWISAQHVTRALVPPSLCDKLAKADLPALLHTVFTGGGPVFPDMLDRLQGTEPDLRLCCVYGSTEAEPIAHLDADTIATADRTNMQNGGGLIVGKPVKGLQLRIVDDEIQVAGAHVNAGYLDPRHDAENKIKDGTTIWHRTGDAGRLDDQGRLWLLGRIGSDVSLAGKGTYPFAIEVAVRGWQGVEQCALIENKGAACLVIGGDPAHLADWQAQASLLHITDVRQIARIPMDRRHASKVDRSALKAWLRT
ncbi:AMP-binding protein [Yoonia sediminilitoris]|uniref:Acyl-CoA synthetase (AMP-forming)/AMP-acid ligase II n=1 Tax=Yoonia sediminilitoris TaxID=1286148 RepID=A0A2T6K699_9RHOB|nr:AMP-binding protein [Yoonia sediminilitoris]PUB10168.1 acyl-CoA synthetase (AMP-forming)/AMP-acid ligase II [Yoonia sediminilitoris]RCW89690.1 acyl-CoA synthetase (AMP-forming)/AMP-acid ligase II [Yoonia sediminilitoris]